MTALKNETLHRAVQGNALNSRKQTLREVSESLPKVERAVVVCVKGCVILERARY